MWSSDNYIRYIISVVNEDYLFRYKNRIVHDLFFANGDMVVQSNIYFNDNTHFNQYDANMMNVIAKASSLPRLCYVGESKL